MASWRDEILKDFPSGICKLTIVRDPDRLFEEALLVQELNCRGYEIVKFGDPIVFRYEYEKEYRSVWDAGKSLNLIVVPEEREKEVITLPYDILKRARTLFYSLGGIFPTLSYPVLQKVDIALIDTLYAKKHLLPSFPVGDIATIDIILKLVYGLQPELIDTNEELLRELLRIHYQHLTLDEFSAMRFASVLKEKPQLKKWPIDILLRDSNTFYEFLQERWPLYLAHKQNDELLDSITIEQTLRIPGPKILQFAEDTIRPFIDNLFTEGMLKPVVVEAPEAFLGSWEQCGILVRKEAAVHSRITKLFQHIEAHIPMGASNYRQWQDFIWPWAELSMLVETEGTSKEMQDLSEMRAAINKQFAEWLTQSFKLLINLSPAQPIMVHHVHRMLERYFEKSKTSNNVALIVIDGLSLSQWISIRHHFETRKAPLKFRETTLFAWVPTLTTISRQAIFAGKSPLSFPNQVETTSQEEMLWRQSWEGQIQSQSLHLYYRKEIEKSNCQELFDTLDSMHEPIVAGLVINIVDEIMHNNILGAHDMQNSLRTWLEQGYLEELLDELIKREYSVWITSDHGNIECEGKGRLSGEGILASERGERARIYTSQNLRDAAAQKLAFSQKWKPIGLPDNYYPLLATGTSAFLNEGEKAISHGSISIEEVLVPLIEVERK